MMPDNMLPYILVMAGVTYLVRALPLTLWRREIRHAYLRSFLHYAPYACLAAMTFPAILSSTGSPVSALCGFAVALLLAYREKSLLTVALSACGTVLLVEQALSFLA